MLQTVLYRKQMVTKLNDVIGLPNVRDLHPIKSREDLL